MCGLCLGVYACVGGSGFRVSELRVDMQGEPLSTGMRTSATEKYISIQMLQVSMYCTRCPSFWKAIDVEALNHRFTSNLDPLRTLTIGACQLAGSADASPAAPL